MPATSVEAGPHIPEGIVEQPQEQDVWVESRVRRPMTPDFAHAITFGGEVWSLTSISIDTTVKPVRFIQASSARWEREGTLLPPEKSELADALVHSDIAHLPSEPPPRKDSVIGGTEVLWTIRMDGTTYRLRRIEAGPGSVPDLETLGKLLFRLATQAQQRRLNEKPAP